MTGDPPLAGVSVVELSVHRAGPFCGALLADLGADVVKVERPGVGDPARNQGPGPADKSGYFMANNRNKRSVELDLKSDAGTDAMLDLLTAADVFVENFGYGVAERLGVGYDAVREVNEDVVYASVKGYGESGPRKEKKGLDLVLQAEGGIMSLTGPEGGDPVKVGQAIGDLTAGMYAAIGVLARLNQRDARDGVDAADPGGQTPADGADEFVGKFDVGLYDAIVSLMNEYVTFHSMTGEVPGPQGRSHQSIVPYQLFETADGYVATGVPSDERWDDFVDVVGREELREYATNNERMEHKAEVVSVVQEEFERESTEHWLEQLTEYGFPNGPLNDLEDVVDDPQTAARNLVVEADDPDAGTVVLPGHPLHFPDFEPAVDSPAPRLGEHTDAVFSEVANDQTTLDEWRDGGAFGD